MKIGGRGWAITILTLTQLVPFADSKHTKIIHLPQNTIILKIFCTTTTKILKKFQSFENMNMSLWNIKFSAVLWAGSRICKLHLLQKGKDSTPKKSVLAIILNWIWWWDSSSEVLGSILSPFNCHYFQVHSDPGSVYPFKMNVKIHWSNECSPMVQETGVQSPVESFQRLKKWYLMLPCLALSTIR